jgi:hypothetical protein
MVCLEEGPGLELHLLPKELANFSSRGLSSNQPTERSRQPGFRHRGFSETQGKREGREQGGLRFLCFWWGMAAGTKVS